MKKRFLSVSSAGVVCGVLLGAAAVSPAQSLWKEGVSRSLVSDDRARSVGDILTILIQENNSATKNNSTQTGKSSSVDASLAAFFYSPTASKLLTKNGELPALRATGKNDFDGGGKINNSETISARLPVTVVDVLPNGNLIIEGKRTTAFGGETQDAVLRGIVRTKDISANNTIYSYNIADATIKYVSKGAISDVQRKGWFTKVWDKITPF
jgi:flagellar L-ring protein precursor FlgH